MCDQQQTHFTLWDIGRQRLELTFEPGAIVSDAGLLALRALEKPLGILTELAQRLPDPRSTLFVRHSTERILTQQVSQILAGYPDCNDADALRQDALFQILAEVTPSGEQPLARFPYALVVLFREANALVPAVAQAEVSTLRQRLWKVPAVLVSGARWLVLRLSAGCSMGTASFGP